MPGPVRGRLVTTDYRPANRVLRPSARAFTREFLLQFSQENPGGVLFCPQDPLPSLAEVLLLPYLVVKKYF